jgi:hypothetical protein
VGQAIVAFPVPGSQVSAPADTNIKNYRGTIIRTSHAINQALRGQLSATLQVTLVANDHTSQFTDSRIGPNSFLGFTPLTWHAANALPGLWFELDGTTVTVHHANSPDTDQLFNVSIIGG